MSKVPVEFDHYASRYEEDLRQSMPLALAEDRYFAEYKVRHVVQRMDRRNSVRLLDYGCGIGRSLNLFAEMLPGVELWGYDVSPRSLDLARERTPNSRLTGDLNELPAASFEVIFVANVFHHIPVSERAGVLARCKGLLGEGGRLFLFEHNPVNPVTRHVFERCPYDQGAAMLPRREALRLADAAGLRVLRATYTLFFPRPVAFLRPLERLLGWLPLGAQYCVEMAK